MNLPYLSEDALEAFIRSAIAEDIGEGDHSARGAVPVNTPATARLLVKDTGILAGVDVAKRIFRKVDNTLEVEVFKSDGDEVKPGDVALLVHGKGRSILSAERLVLNCMQRMSGIATYARRLSHMLDGTKARIMDTRKTTPNFRILEKWAVAIGGGMNHRFGLYDMVMIKDNHVDLAGGVEPAIRNVRKYLSEVKKNLRVEIEVRNMKEVDEVISTGGVDVIMLDNMSLEDMRTAVTKIAGKFKTEASGGIREDNLVDVARCGVDYISIGALTHSVKSLDLSLKVVKP